MLTLKPVSSFTLLFAKPEKCLTSIWYYSLVKPGIEFKRALAYADLGFFFLFLSIHSPPIWITDPFEASLFIVTTIATEGALSQLLVVD